MDSRDKVILNIINDGIPLDQRPWKIVADLVGLPEDDVIARIRRLKTAGIIRRMGATISPRSVGWHSTLCSADVPDDRIDEFAATVNAIEQVTHNYVRSGRPNCWFTLIAPDHQTSLRIMREIVEKTGIAVKEYPSVRVFKIRATFRLD